MESIFTWTGFICLSLAVIAVTALVILFLADYIVRKTNFLYFISKRFSRWNKSFPKRDHHHRYAVTVYDQETGEFLNSKYLNAQWMTDEEWKAQVAEWKKENSKPRPLKEGEQSGATNRDYLQSNRKNT